MNVSLKSYHNKPGYVPRVGDIVVVRQELYDLPWELQRSSNKDVEWLVSNVIVNSKSYSIVIAGYQIQAHKTNLIKKGEPEVKLDENKNWMILNGIDVIDTFETEDDAKTAAKKLVQDDHKKQIVIAKVMAIAKVQAAPVVFV